MVRRRYGEGAEKVGFVLHLPVDSTEKSFRKNICFKIRNFLPLHFEKLSYGVMVAQQILDLFVLVRIQVGQQPLQITA